MGKPKLPTVLPSGTLMMHMRASRRHEIFDTWFEMTGGVERLVHVSNKNDANYLEVAKMWAKGAARPIAITDDRGNSTEDMVDEVERSEKAQVIGGNFTEKDDDDAS